MTRFLRFGAEHPKLALGLALGLTLITLPGLIDPATGIVRLRIDPSMESLLPPGGPERELYEYSRKLLGTDESIVVALGADDVFEPVTLRTVVRLTERLAGIEGVQSVLSLSTAMTVRAVGDDLAVAPLLEEVPEDPAGLKRLRRETLDHPLYGGTLVARDGQATALLVSLDRVSDRELIASGVDARIVHVAREEAAGLEVWVAGAPHQKVFTSTRIAEESAWMLPAILGLAALVLAGSLRSLRGVLLPLASIVCGLIWTLGTLAWLGEELNLVTVTIPALVLMVGFTYALHVVVEYYAEVRATPRATGREATRRTLDAVAVPVLVTGITTCAGFLSLTLNPITAIREFGLFALLGVAFTVLSALTLVPAALALLPRARVRAAGADGYFERGADALARLAVERRRSVIVCSLVVLGIAVVGMTQIRVAIRFPGNMDPKHPLRVDWEEINERFGGATQLRLILRTDLPSGILEPSHLAEIRKLQDWLEDQPEVGETSSIVDHLMMCHRAFHRNDPAYFRVPETKRLASHLLMVCGSAESRRLIDNPRRTTGVLVRARVGDSDRISELSARIEARMRELPSGLSGSVTGNAALLLRVQDDVSRGQLLSISAAFLLIYLVLALMFTDFRVGLLALFPNALPIAVYFGTLGFSGITLNPSTSLVGSLALGIAVDDTVHFFARFNSEARRRGSERSGAGAALRALIRPVTYTTIGLVLGFGVLTLSELGSQVQFGLLAAFTLAVAWLVDVTLTPALCSGARIVTLWDLLRLDLGESPQQSIGLFHGLSVRKARIFALMSDIIEMRAGQRLIAEDEQGDDMFVIIHGELRAWVERGGRDVELSILRRGDVVGEGAYFSARRSANVDVLSDALLIRFDHHDLQRLQRRYPRTAAIVLANLNRVQAVRMKRQLERMSKELVQAQPSGRDREG